jgi:GR25 family glycosyltransferase involved in LPS biosynthesis
MNLYIIFLIFIIIIYLIINHLISFEIINIYVITLQNNDRLNNINNQQNKINYPIEKFIGINGQYINQLELFNKNILSKEFLDKDNIKRSKEIGCYLSHLNLLKKISYNIASKYSIILEDDFIIIDNNVLNKINDILNYLSYNNIDFDIIFLGNTFNNKGKKLNDNNFNIYKINTDVYTIGCFSYLINNKNIFKIINYLNYIDSPIDNKIDSLIKNKKIISYVIYPNLITYNSILDSNILY